MKTLIQLLSFTVVVFLLPVVFRLYDSLHNIAPLDNESDAPIVVEVSVVRWEPATSRDVVHVIPRGVVPHFWIVNLHVERLERGTVSYDELNLVVHSPSMSGVNEVGDRFRFGLRVVDPSNASPHGSPRVMTRDGKVPFSIATPSYELVWAETADARPAFID